MDIARWRQSKKKRKLLKRIRKGFVFWGCNLSSWNDEELEQVLLSSGWTMEKSGITVKEFTEKL